MELFWPWFQCIGQVVGQRSERNTEKEERLASSFPPRWQDKINKWIVVYNAFADYKTTILLSINNFFLELVPELNKVFTSLFKVPFNNLNSNL